MLNLPAIIETDLIPLDIAEHVDALCEAVESIIINDLPTYEQAAKSRKGCRDMVKQLDARRKEYTQPLDDQKAEIMALFKRPQERLAEADKMIAARMIAWDQEQKRKQEEEQRRINEALRAKAEEEKKKAEAAALHALEQGRDHIAERLLEKAAATKPAEVILEAPKASAKGVYYRKQWKWRCIDFAAVPDLAKLLNERVLNAIASAEKENARLPGIEFYCDEVLSQR